MIGSYSPYSLLVARDSDGLGVGGGIGVYGFFAFIMTVRSEKMSRSTVRRFTGIILPSEPKPMGETGLVLPSAESARLMRSSMASKEVSQSHAGGKDAKPISGQDRVARENQSWEKSAKTARLVLWVGGAEEVAVTVAPSLKSQVR